MDEIFDRLKSIKIKRKDLFLPLVLTEILGILVLVWYLKLPLVQKYLIIPPTSYSIDDMKEDKQYLLRQGDFIRGKTKPGSKLRVLLYPEGSNFALTADTDGNFSFQIPLQTGIQQYRLIIINDDLDKLVALKDLKIRVKSNNKLGQLAGSLIE